MSDKLTTALKEIFAIASFDWDSMPEAGRREFQRLVLEISDEALNARPAPDGCVVLRIAQIVEDWQNRDFEGDTLDETIESAWEMSKAVIRETMQGSDTDTEPKHS